MTMKAQHERYPVHWGGPQGAVIGYAHLSNDEVRIKIEDQSVQNTLLAHTIDSFTLATGDGVHVTTYYAHGAPDGDGGKQ